MEFNTKDTGPSEAWLIGFIFADGTIGMQQGYNCIKIYNKDRAILDFIAEKFKLKYSVTPQKNKNNLVYFLRIPDQHFVEYFISIGFKKDKTYMEIPKLTKQLSKYFLCGFLMGKGSYYQNTCDKTYGFKVNFRGGLFIKHLEKLIAKSLNIPRINIYSRKGVNLTTHTLNYRNAKCDIIQSFIQNTFQEITANEKV